MFINDKYTKPFRLQEVIALIHTLGLGKQFQYFSEKSIETVLGKSQSGGWVRIAKEHPEFFRDSSRQRTAISLAIRYLVPIHTTPSAPGTIEMLTKVTLEIHEREVRRSEKLAVYVPIVAAFLAGLLPNLLTHWLR